MTTDLETQAKQFCTCGHSRLAHAGDNGNYDCIAVIEDELMFAYCSCEKFEERKQDEPSAVS